MTDRARRAKARHDGDADYYSGPDARDAVTAFGDKMRVARALKNLSMRDAANAIGVSTMAVSKYETNQMHPSSSTLMAIGKLYGVSLDWLMCDCQVNLGWHHGECADGVLQRAKMRARKGA